MQRCTRIDRGVRNGLCGRRRIGGSDRVAAIIVQVRVLMPGRCTLRLVRGDGQTARHRCIVHTLLQAADRIGGQRAEKQ